MKIEKKIDNDYFLSILYLSFYWCTKFTKNKIPFNKKIYVYLNELQKYGLFSITIKSRIGSPKFGGIYFKSPPKKIADLKKKSINKN
jgi:hypothetical protein